jgi:hypothetical protein
MRDFCKIQKTIFSFGHQSAHRIHKRIPLLWMGINDANEALFGISRADRS